MDTPTSSASAASAVEAPSAAPRGRVVWPWVPIVGAWALFVAATLTGQSYLLEHHTWLAQADVPLWLAALIFLGTWLLMLAAMMGPCVLAPLGAVVRASRVRRRRAWTIQIPYLGAYVGLWCLFGLVAFALDVGRLALTAALPALANAAWAVGVGLVTLAALYQFTPLKRRAVRLCGASDAAAVTRPGAGWRAGGQMGWASVRSAGPLMLIMFGVGMTSLPWLVGLTVIMVAEHRAPWRLRAVSLAGISLAVVAALWTTGATASAAVNDGAIQTQMVGATAVTLTVSPAVYGPTTLTVALAQNGMPLPGATVTLTLTMRDMDMGQQTLTLTPRGDGTYTAPATLTMPGHWAIAVQAQTGTGAIAATFVVLADGRAPTV